MPAGSLQEGYFRDESAEDVVCKARDDEPDAASNTDSQQLEQTGGGRDSQEIKLIDPFGDDR
jgi:hypothetical protein